MSATLRPVHLPVEAACARLQERVQAALNAWASEWLSGARARGATVRLRAADREAVQGGQYEWLRGDPGGLWVRRTALDFMDLGWAVAGTELMPDGECADDWIEVVIERAWQARNRTLYAALFGTSLLGTAPHTPASSEPAAAVDELPAALFTFGCGALQVSCESLGLQAWVEAAAWRSLVLPRKDAARLPAPLPVETAARQARVQLQAVLGGVEIELPTLLDLRSGDVLRLPQRLDQRITLLCEGKPLAQVVLGECQGRKAVRVLTHQQVDNRK